MQTKKYIFVFFLELAGELRTNILRRIKKGWRAPKKLLLIRACNRPSYIQLTTLLLETKLTTRPGTQDHAPKGLQTLRQGKKKLLEHQQKTTAAASH